MENWATKEAFFKCPLPKEKVTAGDLGDIQVIGLTAGQKDEYENNVVSVKAGTKQVKLTNARAVLMQLTVHDRHGNKMFAESDIGKLATLPAKVVDPILDVARRLSGMAAGEIEDLVKNSQTDPGPKKEDSGSGSQRPSESQSAKSEAG